MSDLEEAFRQAVTAIPGAKLPGYNPTYFTRMIHELGAIETAHRLLAKEDVSDGFTKLT